MTNRIFKSRTVEPTELIICGWGMPQELYTNIDEAWDCYQGATTSIGEMTSELLKSGSCVTVHLGAQHKKFRISYMAFPLSKERITSDCVFVSYPRLEHKNPTYLKDVIERHMLNEVMGDICG